MILYPAIDIQNGECVRLRRGDFNEATVFSRDPVARAELFEKEGAEALHVVDLDGAREGRLVNFPIIEEIAETISIPVECGGGIRTIDDLKMINDGAVSRVVIGTGAVVDEYFLREAVKVMDGKLMVSIDADNGMVTTHGWQRRSAVSAVSFARNLSKEGVTHIMYTDIDRDGMMTGMNLRAVQELAEAVELDIVASGGISSLEDLAALRQLDLPHISGVIVGRALYEGRFTIAQAKEVLA